MDKRLLRFRYCDSRFYAYLEKVLNRLPDETREEILNNRGLEILGSKDFLVAFGLYLLFDNQISDIVYLNTRVLREPENWIIHAVAHEFAHYVAKKGETGLYEKEAEDLLVRWGFEKEVEEIDYSRPISESAGYTAGYEWAKEQDEEELWERFGEFYHEWDEERLSNERLEELHYMADPTSILDKMGMLGERRETISPQEFEEANDEPIDIASLEKGIIRGLMGYLKGKRLKKESHSYQREIDEVEVVNTLERIASDLAKLFSLHGIHKYFEEARFAELGEVSLGIEEVLEKLKGNHK